MLRKWYAPPATAYWVEEGAQDEMEVLVWNAGVGQGGQPTVGQQLRTKGRSCRHCCIKLLTCCRTSQARLASWKHSIDTGTAPPAHQALYHLPHAYWETVRAELQQMLEAGIIVRSSSEWASTIVLVGKKDGSLRLCVDYKQHNAVAGTNAYPMLRVDDLIDQVGKGKYLTTFDLARSYWQVPVAQTLSI